MQKADPHWVRDTLVGDTVKGAADAGRQANVPAVEEFIVDVLQGMDRKAVEAKPRFVAGHTSPSDKREIYEEEYERRTGRKLENLTLERDVKQEGRLLTQKELTTGPLASIISRIRVINAKNEDGTDKYPHLRLQMKNLTICMKSPLKETREKAATYIYKLLDQTDAIVGYSWMQPKPTILTLS